MIATGAPAEGGQALLDDIVARFQAAQHRALLLDYDGTLVPYASQPEDAVPDGELRFLLEGLSDVTDELWVVSGRPRRSLEELFDTAPVGLGAEHAAWLRPRGGTWRKLVDRKGPPEELLPALTALVQRYPGSRIEAKELAFTWHYRQAAPRPSDAELALITADLAAGASAIGCMLLPAVLALELRPRSAHKGLVVNALQDAPSLGPAGLAGAFVLVAGDDHTDTDMFAAAPASAVRVAVGDRLAAATVRLRSSRAFRALLGRLAA